MANMVLNFDYQAVPTRQTDIYVDVSSEGMPISPARKPVEEDYIDFLRAENLPDAEISAIVAEGGVSSDPVQLISLALRSSYAVALEKYEQWKASSKFRVGKLTNVNAVQNSLHQIFTWIPGERIINPEFGSDIRRYLYEGITDQNIEAITAEIYQCVQKWEPRVAIDKIVNVQDVADTENNTVRLDIYYHINGLPGEQLKYSFNYYSHAE